MGVPVTLSTDDLTVSDLTMSEEYIVAHEQIGLSLPELWSIDLHALDVAFADDATRARLRGEFEAWAANVPELSEEPGG
jgi:adenosine deaminase